MSKKYIIIWGAITATQVTLCLSKLEIHKIGNLVWNNEMNKRTDQLVYWSEHESFPSFGIGHFIWLPDTTHLPFSQTFPSLCAYLKAHGIKLPHWLELTYQKPAPWKSQQDFLHDHKKIHDLRRLLSSTVELQTNFMIDRLHKLLPKLLLATPIRRRQAVKHNVNLLLSTPLGTYALIDYLNFKGDGLNPEEVFHKHRWGLLQVLLAMPDNLNETNVHAAFAIAAEKILLKLIEVSAPEYNRLKFLNGWTKRVSTYADQKLF